MKLDDARIAYYNMPISGSSDNLFMISPTDLDEIVSVKRAKELGAEEHQNLLDKCFGEVDYNLILPENSTNYLERLIKNAGELEIRFGPLKKEDRPKIIDEVYGIYQIKVDGITVVERVPSNQYRLVKDIIK